MKNDPHKEQRRIWFNRGNFRRAACMQWVRKNKPEVFRIIEDESYRKFPGATKKYKDGSVTAFVDSIAAD